MPFVKPFKELGKNDAAIAGSPRWNVGEAGGKGASLGEMTQASIPVPPGFVVLASAFEKFIAETDIDVEIDATMHTVRHGEIHTVDDASEKIKALILGAKMPAVIAREIKSNFKLLNSKFVAVRSSATAEDSASAAWAGQLETYLNTTEKDLLENVKKCWASLFTPRAIFYRFEKFGDKTHLQKISVAVVVQKMVESEMSGIAFSVHPVTQDYNQLIIEAGLGLGEAIVSGQITPDSYVVEKEPRRILDKNIVTQTRGMFRGNSPTGEGGSEWRNVPKEHGEPPTLTDEQIFELSDLILKIESHYGFPVDIEWAFEKGKFYIVQSRPITTLSSVPDRSQIKKPKLKPVVTRKYGLLISDLFVSASSDPENFRKLLLLENFSLGYGVLFDKWCFDDKIVQLGQKLFEEEKENHGFIDKVFTNVYQVGERLLKKSEEIKNADYSKVSTNELTHIFKDFVEDYQTFAVSLAGWGLQRPIEGELREILKNSDDHDNSLSILSFPVKQNIAAEEQESLWQIGGEIQIKKIEISRFRDLPKEIQNRIIDHTKKYGWINTRGGLDDPWTPKQIFDRIRQDKIVSYKQKLSNIVITREEHESQSESLLLKLKADDWLKRLVAIAKELVYYRTYRTDYLNWVFANIKYSLLKELAARIGISLADILHYRVQEIIDLEKIDVEEINRRKKDFILFSPEPYRTIFSSKPEEINKLTKEFFEVEIVAGSEVKGTTAYVGKVNGRVVLVLNKKDLAKVKAGDVLVSTMTTPDYVVAMEKAAAFVTDEGGITCHAAIVAREMKKPCIIGTKIATQVLKDGDLVEVDANTGVVRILEKAETSENPKWTKVFTRPHTIQRISFLWPFLTTGLPQNKKIKVNEMLVLPADENKYSYYLRENEWLPMLSQLGDYLLSKSSKEQEQEFYDTANVYLSASREVFESDIKKWNNQKLLSWFKKYSKIYANYVMYAFSPWSVDLVLAPRLLEELTVLNLKKANHWLEVLSTPTRHNGMSLQQIELLKIAGRSNPSQHLKTHTKKWFWLPIYNIGDKPWTEKDFEEHLLGIANPEAELEAKEKGLAERQKNYQKVLAEIKPDQDLQRLIETVHLYTYLRDERVDKWRLALYYIESCYEEIARRAGIEPLDATNLLDEEIVNFLEIGTLPSDIGERKKHHAILFRDGVIKVFSDQKKIEDLATRELGVTATIDKNELNGLPAYRGVVIARARVIHRPDELGSLQEGEILVAHHTSPEYVIAMKKAVAIVTDEGGVTSHAAIVSRELKIPCVTATQEGSSIIKTGDLIEIDANSGVVRILEKADTSTTAGPNIISLGGDEWCLSVTRNMSAWHQFLSNEGHYHHNADYGILVPLRLLFLTVDGAHTHCLLIQQNNKEVADSVFAYLNSSRRISKLKSDYERYAKRLISSLNACLKNLTLKNWQKFTADYTRFTAGLYFTVVIGRGGADRLTESLKSRGYSDQEIPRIIATITYPTEHTPLFESQLDLLKIGRLIQQKKLAKPKIKQTLTRWLKDYGMIPVNFCDEPWTIKDAETQLQNALTKNCVNEIARLEKEHNSRVKEARTKLKEINDPGITLLAKIVAEGTYLNEFRKNVFSRVSLDYRSIFAKLAKRASLKSWRDCFYLKPEEMEALIAGKGLRFGDIHKERRLFGAYVDKNGRRIDLDDKTLIEIENYVVAQVSGSSASTITDSMVKGFSASWGVVRGPAKIILSSRDFGKLNPGDILVTTMTSVDFVPIMEKAAAFVTNEGGVTSHASIVAREMGKPCIIGTKIATQVLKDGDFVEVDANTGVVLILEKK